MTFIYSSTTIILMILGGTEPWQLSLDLLHRSPCRVKMAAVIHDQDRRIFSWGWNHSGPDGRGLCAERHALQRANPRRLKGSTIVVRGWNGTNESVSIPCKKCFHALLAAEIETIKFRNRSKSIITTGLEALFLEVFKREAS